MSFLTLYSPLEATFLVLVGLLLPWAAIHSNQRLNSGAPFPPRGRYFAFAFVHLIVLGMFALAVARSGSIVLFGPSSPGWGAAAAVLLVTAAMLGTLPLRWQAASLRRRQRLYLLVPHGWAEVGPYLLVCAAAGIFEEIVYRGVMFRLLSRLAPGWWGPALACAAIFAVSHMLQGWKSSLGVFFIALAFQWLVLATGGLYAAMAAHFLYDALAGVICGRLGAGDSAR